jgi:hypothetical protein
MTTVPARGHGARALDLRRLAVVPLVAGAYTAAVLMRHVG